MVSVSAKARRPSGLSDVSEDATRDVSRPGRRQQFARLSSNVIDRSQRARLICVQLTTLVSVLPPAWV